LMSAFGLFSEYHDRLRVIMVLEKKVQTALCSLPAPSKT
jgi:hypothetical protein